MPLSSAAKQAPAEEKVAEERLGEEIAVAPGEYRRRERVVAAVALIFTWVTFLLIQYDRSRTSEAWLEGWIQAKVAGILTEGDQYRIAIPFFARFMQHHGVLKPAQSIPLLEAFCYGVMLLLLYLQFSWSPAMREARPVRRLAGLGMFLAAVQFPILWFFPYERPETWTTAMYVAAVTLLAVHFERIGVVAAGLIAAVLSVLQAMGRGDAPVVTGGGIVIFAFLSKEMPRARRIAMAVVGALCVLPGGLTQKYLEHLYPLKPGQTKWTFQLFRNLNLAYGPFHIPILLTALTPLLFTLWLVWRKRVPTDVPTRLALLVCVLDLPVYVMMGLVSEVRIYVPYLLLAAPAMGTVWSGYLLGEGEASTAG